MPQNSDKKQTKKLPNRTYPRGDQGTFVYSPDVSVFVTNDVYGVIDLSRHVTSFTLQRNANAPSTFVCTFDNKFSRYDRVVRRMDRIVVYLKRTQWLEVFSGYVSVAPWKTVVPGDAMLQAECTLKRLAYTYWDPHSVEARKLYPQQNAGESQSADGGSAATMFKLLTYVAGWDPGQVQIQRIPPRWLQQAVKIIMQAEDEIDSDPDVQTIKRDIERLLDADGWEGALALAKIGNLENNGDSPLNMGDSLTGGLAPNNGVDQKWFVEVGKRKPPGGQFPPNIGSAPEFFSGFVPQSKLQRVPGLLDEKGNAVHLRPDAAASLTGTAQTEGLLAAIGSTERIQAGYLSYSDQKAVITARMRVHGNDLDKTCSQVSCPAGVSEHGWGTAMDFRAGQSPSEQTMNRYGWMQEADGEGENNRDHWVFVGNYNNGWPAYSGHTNPYEHGNGRGHSARVPSNQYTGDFASSRGGNLGTKPAFATAYFQPSIDNSSLAYTGKRAWINDVPLMQAVADFANASMRDFQSAPNGDFVSYFPDRLGIYGKFPAMLVRDIEITDFKLIISDRNLVTHYVSVGDFTDIDGSGGDLGINALYNSGLISLEMPEVMQLLLGLDKSEDPTGLGRWIIEHFGMRPRRDDNYNIFNPGYNFMLALHRFQEAWCQQWQAIVGFTFMPELMPGMRIELADHALAVYVESVTHSGSRTAGFTTTVTVSTPMHKQRGKWVLLNMEWDPNDFIKGGTSHIIEDDTSEQDAFQQHHNITGLL